MEHTSDDISKVKMAKLHKERGETSMSTEIVELSFGEDLYHFRHAMELGPRCHWPRHARRAANIKNILRLIKDITIYIIIPITVYMYRMTSI